MSKIYRLLTEDDTSAFCHKVSLALSKGWELHGSPAYAFDTDRRIAEEAGCNGFITKPVMPRELKMYLDMSLKKA